MFDCRPTVGCDHGYGDQKFYLTLAVNEKYVEGFVESCLERIGEDDAEERNVTFLL